MSQYLFTDCQELSNTGIKALKLMTKLKDNSQISFPIDFIVKKGTDVLTGIDDSELQEMTMGGQTLKYIEPNVVSSEFEERQVEDRRGRYYEYNITFRFPKIELFTNNQIKDFLFNLDGDFAIANACAIVTDNNDEQWIIGYDLPLVVEQLENTTGGEDNNYVFSLRGRSYSRARKFEDVSRQQPTDFIEINDTDLLLINSGGDQIFI